MTKIKIENLGLIQKIAWSFHLTTGLDFEELVSEGIVAYATGMEDYDPKKGALTTFMWHHISNKLKEYVKKEKKFAEGRVSIEDIDIPSDSTPLFERLTPEAQEIARIVLSQSRHCVVAPRESVYSSISHILHGMGWQDRKIDKGFYDIQIAFSK